jgi:hypothetical protein
MKADGGWHSFSSIGLLSVFLMPVSDPARLGLKRQPDALGTDHGLFFCEGSFWSMAVIFVDKWKGNEMN